jgi:lincosamide nucleotidyltransferase A/C/D/E
LDEGIQIWLIGGWGIDALLGEQTRPHKDLDVIMLLDDVVRMRELLESEGYSLKMLWEENRWAVDARGVETATAYVLHDSEGREFDMHAMRLDDQGNGIPEWEAEGFIFTREDLAGEGTIAGVAVKCISPESQVVCHTGYEIPDEQLRDKQMRDLKLLHERFGVG